MDLLHPLQMDPCGVEAGSPVSVMDLLHPLQMDPCGVEASSAVKSDVSWAASYRWTLVGLKRDDDWSTGEVEDGYRWTLVGLKHITTVYLIV